MFAWPKSYMRSSKLNDNPFWFGKHWNLKIFMKCEVAEPSISFPMPLRLPSSNDGIKRYNYFTSIGLISQSLNKLSIFAIFVSPSSCSFQGAWLQTIVDLYILFVLIKSEFSWASDTYFQSLKHFFWYPVEFLLVFYLLKNSKLHRCSRIFKWRALRE